MKPVAGSSNIIEIVKSMVKNTQLCSVFLYRINAQVKHILCKFDETLIIVEVM
jgi:hypothetical protein